MRVDRHKIEKTSSKPATILRMKNFFRGTSEVFIVVPTDRVELTAKTITDRLRQSWTRTGQVVQLSIDEYEDATHLSNPQDASTTQFQDTTL